MARRFVVCILVLFIWARGFGQEMYSGGIVYGPKAAFNINAPEGWVLGNANEQGLPCVLYPKGSSWAKAKTVIYAKIAGTDFEDVNEFVAFAIKGMEKTHGKPKEKIESGKTKDGRPYFINEYPATKTYSQWERVAYVQLPRRRLHCPLIARSSELLQGFAGFDRSGEICFLCRPQSRVLITTSTLRITDASSDCESV